MKRLILSIIVAVMFVPVYSAVPEVNAQPSISEFTSCVSWFTRRVTAREGNCKWYEFEVAFEGGGEVGTICPCFDEYLLRNGFSFTNPEVVPETDLKCEIAEIGLLDRTQLEIEDETTNRSYVNIVNFLDRPPAVCEIFPDIEDRDSFLTRNEVISPEQFEACKGLVIDWIEDLGLDPAIDCAL